MAKWKSPNGTEVDLGDGVNDATVAAIGTMIGASLEPVTASIAETVKTSLSEALAPVTQEIEQIKKAGAPAPDPKANPPKGGGGDAEPPAWAKGLIEKVDGIAKERDAERDQRTTEQLVKAYFDKHLPNLQGRDVLMRRAVTAKPKDEAALKTLVGEFQQEYASVVGKDAATKAFSASPGKEGAKPADADSAAAEKEARLKRIREATPDVVVKD